MRISRPCCACLLAFVAGSALLPTIASAVNILWDGTSGASWNSPVAWSLVSNGPIPNPAAKPGAADNAIFNITTVHTPQIVNLDVSQFALGLVFNSTGTVLIQSGAGGPNTLTLGTGGITINALAGAVTISSPIALAAAQSWTHNDGTGEFFTINGNISNGNNPLTFAGVGDAIIFGVLGNGNGGLIKNGTGSLTLADSNTFTGGVTINAGTLNLFGAGGLNSTTPNAVAFGAGSTGALSIRGNIVTVSGLTTNATVGAPIVRNDSTLSGTLIVNNNVSNTFAGVLQNGALSGTLALTKTGTGTLVLTGANAYTGGTTVSGGTLQGNTSSLQGNISGSSTSTVVFDQSIDGTFAGTLTSNIFRLTKTGAGSLTINNNNSTGGVTILAGTLDIGSYTPGTIGAITAAGNSDIDGGMLRVNPGSTFGLGAGKTLTVRNGGSANFNMGEPLVINDGSQVNVVSGGSVSVSSAISVGNFMGGLLSIDGAGSTVMLNPHGALTIGNGSLVVVQNGGALTVGSGGTTTLSPTAIINISGGIADFQALDFQGGELNFTAGSLSYIGTLTVGNGGLFGSNLTLASNRQLSVSNITIEPGRVLTLAGGALNTEVLNVQGTLDLNSGAFGAMGGGFAQLEGNGVVNVSTSINAPIFGNSPALTIIVNANGISIGSASNFSGFSHQGTLGVGANTVTLNSFGYARLGVLTTMFGGTINAPNGVTFASGSNFLGGGTVNGRIAAELGSIIQAFGALALGDAASPAGFVSHGELQTKQYAVTLNSTAQATLGNLTTLRHGSSPGTLNATNGLVVDFGHSVTGFGTINSTNTLAKRTIINGVAQGSSMAQRLTFTGYVKGVGTFDNVTFTGTFDPGLSATIVTAGNLALSSTSTLIMELGGTAPGSGHDQIDASGTLGLDGTLAVTLINGFSPMAGSSFNLFDWTSLAGTFDTLQLPALAGLSWDTTQLYTSGLLLVASAGVPGDYNGNGTVDAADYVIWRKNEGTNNVLLNDPISGTIGQAHYDQWRAHFGQTMLGSGLGANLNVAVPEPSANCLTLLALMSGVGTLSGRVVRRSKNRRFR